MALRELRRPLLRVTAAYLVVGPHVDRLGWAVFHGVCVDTPTRQRAALEHGGDRRASLSPRRTPSARGSDTALVHSQRRVQRRYGCAWVGSTPTIWSSAAPLTMPRHGATTRGGDIGPSLKALGNLWRGHARCRATAMTGIESLVASVGVVLVVGFAVHRPGRLLIVARVSHNAGRSVLIAVRCVIDQSLLGELKPLGLSSSCLIHGSALRAPALEATGDGLGRRVLVHARTVLPLLNTQSAATPLADVHVNPIATGLLGLVHMRGHRPICRQRTGPVSHGACPTRNRSLPRPQTRPARPRPACPAARTPKNITFTSARYMHVRRVAGGLSGSRPDGIAERGQPAARNTARILGWPSISSSSTISISSRPTMRASRRRPSDEKPQ